MTRRLIDIGDTRVVTVDCNDSTDKAIALMEEHDIHHLPVTDGGHLVGMLSESDLMQSVGWLPQRDRIGGGHAPGYVGPTQVAQIASAPVVTLPASAGIEEAIRAMLEHDIHAIPLSTNERPAGIVSRLDLLKLYVDDHFRVTRPAWRFAKVRDHMLAHVYSLGPNDTLAAAMRLMRHKRIRHVPVVQDDRLIGIVSDRDIRLAIGRAAVDAGTAEANHIDVPLDDHLSEVMNAEVVTIEPAATLAEAAQRMIDRRISTLPVMLEERMIGILTEDDLLRVLAASLDA
ncbi:MAG: CBS domain-containing protein [Phycisphaerales bacterium]|nr:MAG: CBS domain-containing protein [Phycisphaerales bacterium]